LHSAGPNSYDTPRRMAERTVLFETRGPIARIVLNRPHRLNAINAQMVRELEEAIARANADPQVKVLILSGAGRAFCAGYDLEWGTRAEEEAQEATGGIWDPVRDYLMMWRNVRTFMSLWESPKPTIAQVHGWCVGGGTDMALCCDLIFVAEDAQIGYPPARIWGQPTTVMWVYRLGLEHAKRLMLSGQPLTGKEAVQVGLASAAFPAHRLPEEVEAYAHRLSSIPLNQLVMSKLLVNQAYENMGLRTSQILGTFLDGIARHTPEGIAWRRTVLEEGLREALRRRDAPFGDYSQGSR